LVNELNSQWKLCDLSILASHPVVFWLTCQKQDDDTKNDRYYGLHVGKQDEDAMNDIHYGFRDNHAVVSRLIDRQILTLPELLSVVH